MDIMDSCRRTDRASEKAREALREVVNYEPERDIDGACYAVLHWVVGDTSVLEDIGDPSAGDFCGVLEALDGEIAVGEYGGNGGVRYVFIYDDGLSEYSHCSECGNWNKEPVSSDYTEDWFTELVDDGSPNIRLLHRDDTEELPGAVQEAMEGGQ